MKTEGPFLPRAAAAIVAVTIVLYQAWLMPFFQPFFAGRVELARIVFYAIYASLLAPIAWALTTRADVRRKVLPFGAVAAAGLAVTLLHPIGLVTRAYIISLCVGGAVLVLMLASAPVAVLRLAAGVTVLNAALCLVDLLFADGFTNTVGRAAGLAINPNVAAAAILLGAAASYRAVPRRWQLSFGIVAIGGIAVTLSRSTLLAAAGAVMVPGLAWAWQQVRTRRSLRPALEGLGPAAFVTLAMVAWIGVATVSNRRLAPELHAVVADSLSFRQALALAHEWIAHNENDTVVPSAAQAHRTAPDRAASAAPKADDARIAALDARLADEGIRNTISARTLFLERAMLSYQDNGFFGSGLEAAQALVPHNSFLLFALAFGHIGWLIPLALVGLTFYHAHDARDLPLALAEVGTMAASHDILLTPSLFLPIAIGIGGLIAGDGAVVWPRVSRSVAWGAAAAVALFVTGCVAIVRFAPPLTAARLTPSSIAPLLEVYVANLPPQTFPGVFVPATGADPDGAPMFVREDSRPLVRVPWKTGNRPVAPGQYVVHDTVLFFMPADGSDPRTNGHSIDLGMPHTVGAPLFALLATLALWCGGLLMWFGRSGAARVALVQEAV